MGFFYFFAGRATRHDFDAAGLTDRLDGPAAIAEVPAGIGPEGQTGIVFHRHPNSTLPRPLEWQPAALGSDGTKPLRDYWIGWHQGYPPGPQELQRGLSMRGFDVELGDGNRWRIPLVLACNELDAERVSGLPSEYRVLDSGEIGPAAKREFDPLLARARRLLAGAEDEDAPADPNVFDYVAALLAVAYRIGGNEIAALRLLSCDQAAQCVMLSLDWSERVRARLPAGEREKLEKAGMI